ncbi:MAG: tripartite tricarboxylate transporter substrate binding protein [Betaproteobacteria bacterium]|nr:tripartite tricarboxylate transporter substrate binding protein [Betaproteobacteria bacterium]
MARASLACAWLALAIAATLPAAHAQTGNWPNKTVRVIVPLAPGGGNDIIARLFAALLTAEFGQQFIVDNRSGAGGTIGAEIAARANPDGYTLITVPASYAANAALYKLAYDPVKGIAPIGMITTGPLILTVHPSVQATHLKEFIALARAKPGALNFGSSGSGSFSHLAAELFRQMSRTEMVHVPYKSAGPALVDLLGGQIQMFFGSGPSTGGHIRAGRLRGLAVTTAKRSPALPDLPAIGELLPGYSADFWFGMWAPAGSPKAVISRLNQTLARILKQPDVLERLRTDSLEPVGSTPEEFARVIARDIATWSKVVRAGNIKVD